MKSKHICPKCSSTRFITVAHVAQDWIVDQNGNFLEESITTDTIAEPDDDNTWTCAKCGSVAIVA